MALSILDGNQSATTLSTILSSGQHITAHTVVSLGTQAITDMRGAVSGSVVSISNLPSTQTIAGTVTALAGNNFSQEIYNGIFSFSENAQMGVYVTDPLPNGSNNIGRVTVAGTVTLGAGTAQIGSVTVGNSVTIGSLPAIFADPSGFQTVVAGINDAEVNTIRTVLWIPQENGSDGEMLSQLNPLPISGTVTANSSNGSLTTRFGSVTTANTAFATSAVTNANRKYLLIQNVTTSSNVITVGIGFTPTTTQGIQIVAGATITFDGNYIPTGSVRILSSVTASNFTVLEA